MLSIYHNLWNISQIVLKHRTFVLAVITKQSKKTYIALANSALVKSSDKVGPGLHFP